MFYFQFNQKERKKNPKVRFVRVLIKEDQEDIFYKLNVSKNNKGNMLKSRKRRKREAFAKGTALNNQKEKASVRGGPQNQICEIMVSEFPTESAESNNKHILCEEATMILVSDT